MRLHYLCSRRCSFCFEDEREEGWVEAWRGVAWRRVRCVRVGSMSLASPRRDAEVIFALSWKSWVQGWVLSRHPPPFAFPLTCKALCEPYRHSVILLPVNESFTIRLQLLLSLNVYDGFVVNVLLEIYCNSRTLLFCVVCFRVGDEWVHSQLLTNTISTVIRY